MGDMGGLGHLTSASQIANINGAPGDIYWNMAMTPQGTSGSKTAVLGWVRLTQSNAGRTNNTLDVDYMEMRVPVSG
jgi:hypothetical protein